MEFDKTKVYTALNADESLIGAKGYFAENINALDFKVSREEECYEITEIRENIIWNRLGGSNFFYLVEPAPSKPKYRPFKDSDELIDYFCKKHSVPKTDWGMPFIWVKDKTYENRCLVTEIYRNAVSIGSCNETTHLTELFEDYTFLDGSVCGVEDE